MTHPEQTAILFFLLSALTGLAAGPALRLLRAAVARAAADDANARLVLEDHIHNCLRAPEGESHEKALDELRQAVRLQLLLAASAPHRLLLGLRPFNPLDLRAWLVTPPRRRHWREIVGPASDYLPRSVWQCLNRLQAVHPLPFGDSLSAHSTIRLWVVDASRRRIISHDTCRIISACLDDAPHSARVTRRYCAYDDWMSPLDYNEDGVAENTFAVAGSDRVDFPFARFPRSTVRKPARPRRPTELERRLFLALFSYSLLTPEEVRSSFEWLYGVRLKIRFVRRALRTMHRAGFVCRSTAGGAERFALSPLADSFPFEYPRPPFEIRNPRLLDTGGDAGPLGAYENLPPLPDQFAGPDAAPAEWEPDWEAGWEHEWEPEWPTTGDGTHDDDWIFDQENTQTVTHTTPAAVTNSHYEFLLAQGLAPDDEKLRADAGRVICLFEDEHLTVAALDDLLYHRTPYSMIFEVFEYERVLNVLAAARTLPDLEAEALLLYSRVRPEELAELASEASESRAEAYAALYF